MVYVEIRCQDFVFGLGLSWVRSELEDSELSLRPFRRAHMESLRLFTLCVRIIHLYIYIYLYISFYACIAYLLIYIHRKNI